MMVSISSRTRSGIRLGQVDLVQHGQHFESLVDRGDAVRDRLRLDPLRGIHDQQRALAGRQRTRHLVAEVDVAGRVDEVELALAPGAGRVAQGDALRLDGDAALPLELHGVEHLRLHLPLRQAPAAFDQPIGEGRLAVVDVGDDGEVADVVDDRQGTRYRRQSRHGDFTSGGESHPGGDILDAGMKPQHTADVLIVGAGAAGLAAALRIADRARVLVLSKDGIEGGSTNRAQGGIAAVMHPRDSVARHVRDTIQAGAGLCDAEIVQFVVERGPDAIRRLLEYGLTLDREGAEFHLTREGGHTRRRVLHVADRTGQAIETTLVERALAHPNIALLTDRLAIDVITAEKFGFSPNRVLGAYVYNRTTEAVELVRAPHVVLATGGASKVYLYTSNPDGATGDGIAMAWRAGCRVGNMEFNQFHPTCLYHPEARSFLISEAVRGEGGRLLLPNGEPFMDRFDPRGELASRDVVARAIDHEIKRLGGRLRVPRHQPPFPRLHRVALPDDPRPLPVRRDRHRAGPDPGRAGGALHLRRRRRGPVRRHRRGGPLRDR